MTNTETICFQNNNPYILNSFATEESSKDPVVHPVEERDSVSEETNLYEQPSEEELEGDAETIEALHAASNRTPLTRDEINKMISIAYRPELISKTAYTDNERIFVTLHTDPTLTEYEKEALYAYLYYANEGLLISRVKSIYDKYVAAAKFKVDRQELHDICNSIFGNALHTYDPFHSSSSKFSYYLTNGLTIGMIGFLKGEGKHLIVSSLDDEISDSDGSTVTVGDKVRSNSPTPDQLSDLEGVKELIRDCVYDCLNIDERWVIVNCHEPVSVLFGFQPMRQEDAAAYISQSQSKISTSLTNAKEKIEAEIRRAGYSF